MSGTIAWFGNNAVAANLVMVFIIASGLVASTSIRAEIFAEIALDRISIQVPYLGAAPEEVESGVVIRIEEAIQGIDGIRRIHATASEGLASVTVELDFNADARRVLDEIKNRIDAVTTFPLETEEPIISEVIARTQVVDVAISGNADLFTLKTLAERVRAELSALPGITQVDLVGAPPYEISIEVSEAALRRHAMSFDQIAEAVRRESLDLPGGSVRTDGGEIQLRTTGQAYRGAEYEDLVLWTRPDGSRLRGRRRGDGGRRLRGDAVPGAVAGAQQIAKPVVFAVLTTVAAFLPLLLVPGFIGKAFRAVPLIVIPCLLFSLVESLAILPAHLAHVSKPRALGRWGRLQQGRFLGALDTGYMTATVTMPQGVPVAATVSALQRLEDGAARPARAAAASWSPGDALVDGVVDLPLSRIAAASAAGRSRGAGACWSLDYGGATAGWTVSDAPGRRCTGARERPGHRTPIRQAGHGEPSA